MRAAVLLLPLLVGCAGVGFGDARVRTSGNANQDTITMKGPCSITQGTEGSDFTVACEKGGEAVWTFQESINAELYQNLLKAILEAAAAAAPAG